MRKKPKGICHRINNLFLTLIILPSLSLHTAFAAPAQPCYPDYPDDHFGPLQSYTMTLPGGCVVQVSYFTRIADNGNLFDVQINRIVRTPAGDPACDYLDAMSIAQILELVTVQLLEEDPMGFPPGPDECETNWRVIKGNCWSRLEIPFNPESPSIHYYPCEPDMCCLKPYTVCEDACGNRTVHEGGATPQGDCSAVVPPPYGGPCEPVCN